MTILHSLRKAAYAADAARVAYAADAEQEWQKEELLRLIEGAE